MISLVLVGKLFGIAFDLGHNQVVIYFTFSAAILKSWLVYPEKTWYLKGMNFFLGKKVELIYFFNFLGVLSNTWCLFFRKQSFFFSSLSSSSSSVL